MSIADDIGKLALEDQRRMMVAASMPWGKEQDTRAVWREVSNVWDIERGSNKMVKAQGERAAYLDRLQAQLDETKSKR